MILEEPWLEWSNSHWIKYEWLCTECDSLMELSTYWKEEYVTIPDCPCPHKQIIEIGRHVLDLSSNVSYHSEVNQ